MSPKAEAKTLGWALFFVRVALAGLFVAHGLQKLVDLRAGIGIDDASQLILGLGGRNEAALRWVVGGIEFLGGSLLLVGLFARMASAPLLAYMGFLLYLVVRQRGDFFLRAGATRAGEHYLILMACLFAILLAGAGRLSLDRQLFKK
ncbi:MAG: DoxX family protein [Planctomycetes bacterium]|nr:DoxX family protein [Planctomycetota bacterium]